MVDLSPLDGLNRDELRHLVHKVATFVDPRDIAGARWEAAQADSDRIFKAWMAAEEKADALAAESRLRPRDHKLIYRRDLAYADAAKARIARGRADRRQEKRWKELQAHFLKDAK